MRVQHIKNRFIGDFLYNKRKIRISNFPNIHCIESTNQCNLKCVMCPRKDMTRKIAFMDFSLFRKVINECNKQMDFVKLHHMGEPLLHPKLIDMINYCGEMGLNTGITTNATLLNDVLSQKILESSLGRISFSVDGATKATYENIRKNADFNRTVNNIISFLKLKDEGHYKKPLTAIRFTLMDETEEEISEFYEIWKPQKLDSIEIKYFDTYAGQLKGIDFASRPEHYIELNGAYKRYRERQPCKWFWHNLVILSDGSIVPCIRDFDGKLALGNIADTSLKEVWNGEKMVKLRKEQVQLNFRNGLCDNCTEWIGAPPNPLYPLDINLYRGFKEYLRKISLIKPGINTAPFEDF